ncbi:DUF4279 domain-containing protein [Phytomonospora sp. NPDC050363]|uniref:DUF4279 domain-containing protein n=1 Tax=Phytomonospora sp. NPDC050363 TaxID=3155642 RepID=UPI0033DC5046
MRMSQYVYFAIKSETMPATEITARLGVEPDRFSVRGSRRADPPVPVCHSWQVRCDERGLRVDEQIDRVLARLTPVTAKIAELCREPDEVAAVLEVVRFFEDEDGEDPKPQPAEENLVRIPDQHLLGWVLDRRVIEFLAATGAFLDVDEYD